MLCLSRWCCLSIVLTAALLSNAQAARLSLSKLDLTKMSAGWGEPRVDTNCVGNRMSIGGASYAHGVGTHADSFLHVQLDGKVERFSAQVGVDDETGGKGTIIFQVFADGKKRFDSGLMRGGDAARPVDITLSGVRQLVLMVSSGGDDIHFDHADWAEAEFSYGDTPPRAVERPVIDEEKVILTPPPGPEPRINGPRLFGARPGRPFLYRIPCTGDRPMTFGVEDLPGGLRVDAQSGIITGRVPADHGSYKMTLTSRNEAGSARKAFTLMVGDTLALTPPMGWNSWYIHYHRVTGQVMREAADAMVESGMADFGYTYVNIDDCWMRMEPEYYPQVKARMGEFSMEGVLGRVRDQRGNILPNANFSDIHSMTDYIHGKGLRAGIYTSPGPRTCQRYAASYEHERQDAEQYARWGFDFLKYDWCSYGQVYKQRMQQTRDDLSEKQLPYRQMGDILRTLDRDIVYNLCQYGMNSVWEWGGSVGGNCWRTTGDLGLQRGSRLPGFYQIGMSNAEHWQFARPGQWNDPDYILIGWVGSARQLGVGTKTTLTGNEQYSYMSMWSLMAAPLIFSGDMAKLDEFTLNVLCNAEVIDVNQDALGKQARPVVQDAEKLILVKPLEDQSMAVGIFNLTEVPQVMNVDWETLGIQGRQHVRDVWRQKDEGTFDSQYEATIERHGVRFIRLRPVR